MTHLYILKMLMVEIEIICFNFRAQDSEQLEKVDIYLSILLVLSISFKGFTY